MHEADRKAYEKAIWRVFTQSILPLDTDEIADILETDAEHVAYVLSNVPNPWEQGHAKQQPTTQGR